VEIGVHNKISEADWIAPVLSRLRIPWPISVVTPPDHAHGRQPYVIRE